MKLLLAVLMVAAVAGRAPAAPTCFGPSPYLQKSDSPFDMSGLGTTFFLDDFEGPTRVAGVTPSTGSLVGFPMSIIDSVDADDGTIDGSGLMGHSWFSDSGSVGVTWTFDPETLGGLPTEAGIVWTDGGGQVSFKAIAADGTTVLCDSGPVSDPGVFPDGSNNGETAEDRFFGVSDPGGIASIFLSNSSGGIEMDHVQFGAILPTTTTTTSTTSTTSSSTAVPTTTSSSTSSSTAAPPPTSTSSSSTTAAPTTSTAHPTTSVPPTTTSTTTTTLESRCALAPTFDSILCLLDALVADVDAASDLGRLKAGIRAAVTKAEKQAVKARDAGTGKVAKTQLKKAVQSLKTFEHKLDSNNAKKLIPQSTRDRLRAASAQIRGEMQSLRGTL